jgi:hypothetical protein
LQTRREPIHGGSVASSRPSQMGVVQLRTKLRLVDACFTHPWRATVCRSAAGCRALAAVPRGVAGSHRGERGATAPRGSASVTVPAALRRADSPGLRACAAAAAHSASPRKRACLRLWHRSEGLAPGWLSADRWPPGRRPASPHGWVHGVSADKQPGGRPGFGEKFAGKPAPTYPIEDAP